VTVQIVASRQHKAQRSGVGARELGPASSSAEDAPYAMAARYPQEAGLKRVMQGSQDPLTCATYPRCLSTADSWS
jgi:hypothetical protein